MTQRFSPVIKADVRFCGDQKWLHVNVWFRDSDDLDGLINALIELRDTVSDEYDHVHLQHRDLAVGQQVGLAEVNFFRPGRRATEVERELADTAARWLLEQSASSRT
jgi:hypothetical protein